MKRVASGIFVLLMLSIQSCSMAAETAPKPVISGLTVFTTSDLGDRGKAVFARCFFTGISGKVRNPGGKSVKNVVIEVSMKRIPVEPDCPKEDLDSAKSSPSTKIEALAPGEEKEFKIEARFFGGESNASGAGRMRIAGATDACGTIKVEVTSFEVGN